MEGYTFNVIFRLAVRSLYESKPFAFILQSSSYRPYEAQAHTVRFVSFSTCYPDNSRPLVDLTSEIAVLLPLMTNLCS